MFLEAGQQGTPTSVIQSLSISVKCISGDSIGWLNFPENNENCEVGGERSQQSFKD